MLESKIEIMIEYAKCFIKTPYIWGGNNFEGMDCSGFVQECLGAISLDPPGDQSAQTLHDILEKSWEEKLTKGSVLFFGKSKISITHTAIALNEFAMIEAGGGNQWTRTEEEAKKANAFIRIRLISRRSDLVATLYPRGDK